MLRTYSFYLIITVLMIWSSALPLDYGFSYIPVWTHIHYTTNYSDGTNIYPRASAAIWTDTNNNVWLFGGENDVSNESSVQTLYNDVWMLMNHSNVWIQVYNGSSTEEELNQTWIDIILDPTPRKLSYICGKTDDFLIIYGGKTANNSAIFDTWLFDLQLLIWTLLSTGDHSDNIEPLKRVSTNTWCITDKSFWIYSGFGADGKVLSDFWELSMDDKEWYPVRINKSRNQSLDTLKPEGCEDAITWVGPNYDLYLIGGLGPSGTLTNFYLWKFSTRFSKWFAVIKKWDKTKTSLLPFQRKKSLIWVDSDGNLWLYGGEMLKPYLDENILFSDLWLYDISNFEWLRIFNHRTIPENELPGVRTRASTWKKDDDQFYFLGGISLSNESNQIVKSDSWRLSIRLQIRPNRNLISSKTQNILIINNDGKSPRVTHNYTIGPVVFFSLSGGIFLIVGMIWFARRCVIKCPHEPSSLLSKKARMYTNMTHETDLSHQSVPT